MIWAGQGYSTATLEQFFDERGPERSKKIRAASADLNGTHGLVIADRTTAHLGADPLHIIKLANPAVDEVRRAEWNTANHLGCGHLSAAAVIAMIYLCCSGITIRKVRRT